MELDWKLIWSVFWIWSGFEADSGLGVDMEWIFVHAPIEGKPNCCTTLRSSQLQKLAAHLTGILVESQPPFSNFQTFKLFKLSNFQTLKLSNFSNFHTFKD